MKIPKKIISLIEGSEKKKVEFKKSFNKSKIKETMLGFANAEGGIILVGVKEIFSKEGYQKGKIEGLQNRNIDEDKEEVYKMSINFIPNVDCKFIEYYSNDAELIYAITIKKSEEKPVCTSGGRYKIRGQKGNNAINPDMMRSIIFNEKERLIILKKEFQTNQREIHHQISLLQSNIDLGFIEPLSRYKMFSLISFMGTPSHFLLENYGQLEGLYHGLTILNTLLDNFHHLAMMSSRNYQNGIAQYIEHGNDIISQIKNIDKIIQNRIVELTI